jgi:predicted phage gp36 major capsid-like protein
MPITPEEIEAEHQRALDSLTKEQRWALSRLQRAQQESHFNHKKMMDNLERIFEDEAQRRNEAEESRKQHQADKACEADKPEA